ncbi:hypothetical protein DPEC_G00096650 [Dallia pectoralis]|uniref:Uncharacterized protein n=1 Tax=Dallia pectoralis TaxID=75939 RepID=A0ACC2GVC3_DALPE|nr:hypothetical protein DPEC_G00096650 [Dallia pectoralis]
MLSIIRVRNCSAKLQTSSRLYMVFLPCPTKGIFLFSHIQRQIWYAYLPEIGSSGGLIFAENHFKVRLPGPGRCL